MSSNSDEQNPRLESSFIKRMFRAAMLDTTLYEEVEENTQATFQALMVVLLASLAAGLSQVASLSPQKMALLGLTDLISWILWASLSALIGAKLLPEPQTRTNLGEMLRTIGFASSPGLLMVFRFIPGIGDLLALLINFWLLAAMVVAIRQALDYESWWRAVVVCFIGWLIRIAISFGAFFWI